MLATHWRKIVKFILLAVILWVISRGWAMNLQIILNAPSMSEEIFFRIVGAILVPIGAAFGYI